MKKVIFAFLGFGLAGTIAPASLRLYDYDINPAAYNRFSSFSTTSATLNTDTSFIGAGYDLSGWGWDDGGWAVSLISPLHFVQANHAHTGVGQTIYFINAAGLVVQATVASQTLMGGDLTLGTLTAPIAADNGIHAFSVAFGDNQSMAGDSLLVGGRGGLLGTNTVDSATGFLVYDYDSITGEAMPQSGDSTSPTFVVDGGTLLLASVHSYVNKLPDPTVAYDTNLNAYFPTIQSTMLTDGYSLVAVPEPASVASFFGLGCGLAAAAHRFRRRGRLPPKA
ncbi:hypothetical protein [Rariglobus hedericola]|uniref:Uncharacterized protein n=1 Tax=Rariglobus hedericola TaxID=2597822 RepID=A0A556QGG2_9BACT|nr:hypothetical protein [Rariglobus hedericola]TSJ75730.1 hypothetical protein FPL22_15800 [Rariglobus hedericola]